MVANVKNPNPVPVEKEVELRPSEKLLEAFQYVNSETEVLIAELFQKLQPLLDQRPTPSCDDKIPCPDATYNSQFFQSLQDKIITHRALNRRLREFLDLVEV